MAGRRGPTRRERMIMTEDKARKIATRQRMAETGEPYSVARHAVEREHSGPEAAEGGARFGARERADEARQLADGRLLVGCVSIGEPIREKPVAIGGDNAKASCRLIALAFSEMQAAACPGGVERGPLRGTGDFPGKLGGFPRRGRSLWCEAQAEIRGNDAWRGD